MFQMLYNQKNSVKITCFVLFELNLNFTSFASIFIFIQNWIYWTSQMINTILGLVLLFKSSGHMFPRWLHGPAFIEHYDFCFAMMMSHNNSSKTVESSHTNLYYQLLQLLSRAATCSLFAISVIMGICGGDIAVSGGHFTGHMRVHLTLHLESAHTSVEQFRHQVELRFVILVYRVMQYLLVYSQRNAILRLRWRRHFTPHCLPPIFLGKLGESLWKLRSRETHT